MSAATDYRFTGADGLQLYSRIYAGPAPQAPTVLCLHGLMHNGADFEELAPQLAVQHRVIVPDVRGRGLSARDARPANYQIPTYLADVAALLKGLAVSRVAVIGTSMGGLIGMVLAAAQPDLVSRLVLNDIGPEIDAAGLERIRAYAGRTPPVHDWTQAAAQLRSIFGAAWPGLSEARWQQLARRSYRTDARGLLHKDADPAIGEVLRDAQGPAPDLWPLWQGLAQLPVLVIRGATSDILSAATVARMQRGRADLEVLTVADRGHAPLLDEPQCVARITRFLAPQ
jgi:pimeloyl-ACP methyl ester carboxylesterase